MKELILVSKDNESSFWLARTTDGYNVTEMTIYCIHCGSRIGVPFKGAKCSCEGSKEELEIKSELKKQEQALKSKQKALVDKIQLLSIKTRNLVEKEKK